MAFNSDFDVTMEESQSPISITSEIDDKEKLNLDFWNDSTSDVITPPGRDDVKEHAGKDLFGFWGDAGDKNLKISDLKKGPHGRTTVKFRTTFKSEVGGRNVQHIRFHAIDDTGEIEVVAFGETAQVVNNLVQVNKLYSLSRFYVRNESTNYPTGYPHGLQIVLEDDAKVEPLEKDEQIPEIPFSFVGLDLIGDAAISGPFDVLAIIVGICNLDEVKTKGNNGKMFKRDISITDRSKTMGILTLWGDAAKNFSDDNLFKIVALRRASLSMIRGVPKLSTSYKPANTLVWVDPDIEPAVELQEWFQENNPKRKKMG